jgi:putative serine protease PepD
VDRSPSPPPRPQPQPPDDNPAPHGPASQGAPTPSWEASWEAQGGAYPERATDVVERPWQGRERGWRDGTAAVRDSFTVAPGSVPPPYGPPPQWSGAESQPRRQRRGPLIAGVALSSLLAGVLGGFVGGRLSSGQAAEPVVLRPVVQEVVASGKTSATQVQAVASGLLPVTVQIRTDEGSRGGTGSGVIMRPDGYVLTNNHVIAGADTITVVLPNSEAIEGRLVGADPANDLAVVRVERDGLPVANFGKSAELKVGELAVAVGSPFGLQGSVTAGIVSALHRVVEVGDDERLVNAIQTDASINPGNSGGALANGRGQVIGINTAIATEGGTDANVGVGFAIPIDEALEVAGELIAGREVQTPRLGVEGGIDLTPAVAERYGVKGRTGALVTRVEGGSAADKAGMRTGDLVVRIGDDQINGWDQLVVAVRKAEIGKAMLVVVVREGREITLQVTPTERP